MRQESGGEATTRKALERYQLGRRVRQLRLRKKLSLKELAGHTGLSASMLSQLETGKVVPSLETLVRIGMVFDVSLEYFFSEGAGGRTFVVVKAADRVKLPDTPGEERPAYLFENLAFPALNKPLEAYVAEFPVRTTPSRPHAHPSYELIYVVSGGVEITYEGQSWVLGEGDSAYFDGTGEHTYRGLGPEPTRAIVVSVSCEGRGQGGGV